LAFDIVVVIADDGPWALRDACPHYGVPLSDGKLRNGHLECSWHAWQIDFRTGSCLHNPRTQAATYRTEIVDDALFVLANP
jgi:apoptosis-inducing factor 3